MGVVSITFSARHGRTLCLKGLYIFLFLHNVPNKFGSISTCIQWFNIYGQDLGNLAVCFLRQDDLFLEFATAGEHGRRHFGSIQVMCRKFLGQRLRRYPNSSSIFQLLRLLISCDVNPNPGPTTKQRCPSCSRTIARNHHSLVCNLCRGTYDIKFGKVASLELKQL